MTGEREGCVVTGEREGRSVGDKVGSPGVTVGDEEGLRVGDDVGAFVVGERLGWDVG